jgi:hypothetical protein
MTNQTEKQIIGRYGIPRDEMIRFRKDSLHEGVDWVRQANGARPAHLCPVEFTDIGLKKVQDRFSIKLQQATPDDVWPKVGLVSKNDYPNRRMMDVLIDGKTARVRVHDSLLFYVGAEVKVDRRGAALICSQRPASTRILFNALRRKHDEQRKAK